MFQQDTAQKLYDLLSEFHVASKRLEIESGLTQERLDILRLLVGTGPKTINQLAELEKVSAPAITRTVKSLEKLGYVIKSRSKTDQRVVFVAATRKSQQAIDGIRLQQQKLVAEMMKGVDSDGVETIAKGINLLINKG